MNVYNVEIFFTREYYLDGFSLMLPRIDVSDEDDDAVINLNDKLLELER